VGSLHIYESDIVKANAIHSVGEPTRDELVYEPKWGALGMGIGTISRRARAILSGRTVKMLTPYEEYLAAAVTVGL
jgi:hypothetical protein